MVQYFLSPIRWWGFAAGMVLFAVAAGGWTGLAAAAPTAHTPQAWLAEGNQGEGVLPAAASETAEARRGPRQGTQSSGSRAGWGPIHGMYRLTWREGGEEREAPAALRHEATIRWSQVGLSLYSSWERPLTSLPPSSRGTGSFNSDLPGFQVDWRRPESAKGMALTEAGVRLGLRPPGSVDPFRLFYPASGDAWRWAAYGNMEARLGETVWEAAAHRASGSPRGDEGVWATVRGRTARDTVRWRFTGVQGERLGQHRYGAWALDGELTSRWGRWSGGYARREVFSPRVFDGAGFLRWRSPRFGRWTVTAEAFRRDEGFRLPVGGDLPWKAGTKGVSWRVRWGGRPWEGQWEQKVTTPLPSPADPARGEPVPAEPTVHETAYQWTWRPTKPWWLRMRYEERSHGERQRYEAYVRWPRQGISLLARWDEKPELRRLWRLERTWSGRRLRLDWDERWSAWRGEYRREWAPVALRIVVKGRDDPRRGGAEGGRQSFFFVEGTYRTDRWALTIASGWDDQGRIDWHWAKPPRWMVTWETVF